MIIQPIREIRTCVAIDANVLVTLGRMLHTKARILEVIRETCKIAIPNATVEITDLRKSYE